MAPSSVGAEVPLNKYFEFSNAVEEESPEEPLPEKREASLNRGFPCITNKCLCDLTIHMCKSPIKSITDFAGVSDMYY